MDPFPLKVTGGLRGGEMEKVSGTLDGEGRKKCATTGLYEPPPHRGKSTPLKMHQWPASRRNGKPVRDAGRRGAAAHLPPHPVPVDLVDLHFGSPYMLSVCPKCEF